MSDKLQQLSEIEGIGIIEMIEEATNDSVAWGICTNSGCEYTTQVEPDCANGYCEECATQTVQSCLMLAEMI